MSRKNKDKELEQNQQINKKEVEKASSAVENGAGAGSAASEESEVKAEPEVEGDDKADARPRTPDEKSPADEIEELKSNLAAKSDDYLRLMAEFDNYRRRTAKERLDMVSTAGSDIISGFLPVLDDFERALQVQKEMEAPEALVQGTELIYNKLMSYLKSKGLSVIEAVGKEFDTDFHEAVAQFPAQEPEMKNKVIDVAQQGYLLNGKVLRFAKVVVGI